MGLVSKYLLSLNLVINLGHANDAKTPIVLKELLTKQATENIRFISSDAKFTYYQKQSGTLHFATNYEAKEFITGKKNSNYTMYSSNARKKLIVTQNENFHSYYSIRANDNIFILDYGKFNARKIATGASPALHLNDQWLSYYNFQDHKLNFVNTENEIIKYNVTLNNPVNPYFSPDAIMLDENNIIYTDLSGNGEYAILQFKKSETEPKLLYKLKDAKTKIEICLNDNQLFIGEFGLDNNSVGSKIYQISVPFTDINKKTLVYQSGLNDIGQMICNYNSNKLMFIKTLIEKEDYITEAYEIDLTTKALEAKSNQKSLTSIFNMDGILVAMNKGKYFLIQGGVNFKASDSLQFLAPEISTEVKEN